MIAYGKNKYSKCLVPTQATHYIRIFDGMNNERLMIIKRAQDEQIISIYSVHIYALRMHPKNRNTTQFKIRHKSVFYFIWIFSFIFDSTKNLVDFFGEIVWWKRKNCARLCHFILSATQSFTERKKWRMKLNWNCSPIVDTDGSQVS